MKNLLLLFALIAACGLQQAFGQWNTSGTNIYNTNSGNVGIGNSSPATLLHVQKNMTEPTITVQNLGGIGGATYSMMDNASGANWKFKATNSGGFKIRDHAYGLDVMTFEANSIANAIYINAAGNVGVRTTTPAANFHVAKTTPSYTAAFGPSVSPWQAGTNVAVGNDNEDAVLYVGQAPGYEGFLIWQYNVTPSNGYFSIGTYNGANNIDLQEYGGKVGINTSSPQALLDVNTDSYSYARLGNSNSTCNYFFHNENPVDGYGQSAVFGYRTHTSQSDGSGYGNYESNSAIKGYTYWGDLYSFGTCGFNDLDLTRCGGVLGGYTYGTYWGSLGYVTSGNLWYGGYFTASANGSGKSMQPANIGIGIGAWGDLFGADIHGKVYGIYAEGDNYAMYSHGTTYKDNLDVHLQANKDGTNTPLYTNVSADVTIITAGTAVLSQGRANVVFDKTFSGCISTQEPVIVTVTPIGGSNAVSLSEVTSSGFSVVELNNGKSSVTVNYIAIGKRAGYEKPKLAKEVIDAGYVNKLTRGLHNDNDLQTNGEGLYYENGQLVVGIHPSTLPDPNKKVEKAPENQGNPDNSVPDAGGVRH